MEASLTLQEKESNAMQCNAMQCTMNVKPWSRAGLQVAALRSAPFALGKPAAGE